MLLAHLVVTYDMKFEEGKGVLRDLYIATMCIARASDVMFKTRQVKKNPSNSASHPDEYPLLGVKISTYL